MQVWDAETGEPVTPPIEHQGGVFAASFSPDGRRLLTGSREWRYDGKGKVRLLDLATLDLPVEDVLLLAGLLSGRHLDASGALVPLEQHQVRQAWQKLRPKYPKLFTATSSSQ